MKDAKKKMCFFFISDFTTMYILSAHFMPQLPWSCTEFTTLCRFHCVGFPMSSTLQDGIGSDWTVALSIRLPVKSPTVLPFFLSAKSWHAAPGSVLPFVTRHKSSRRGPATFPPSVWDYVWCQLWGQTLLVPRDVRYGILFLLLCLRAVKWRVFLQLALSGRCRQLSLRTAASHLKYSCIRCVTQTVVRQCVRAGQPLILITQHKRWDRCGNMLVSAVAHI